MRAIALIDGEHHPAVVRDALDRLAREHELCGVLFVGGEEKVGDEVMADPGAHYGREVAGIGAEPASALRELVGASGAQVVVDLSGEPALPPSERDRLACVALDLGLGYRAPGLELRPPPRERLEYDGPVLEVIGTGKRTGKTAVAGHWARLLADRGVDPVIVCMGRGGPPLPEVVRADERPDLRRLREIARGGAHAASDYLEDAVLAGVSCVGCRRCGEGPAGETFDSNVLEGARLALSLEPDALLIEGSGAALPPVDAGCTVCVTRASTAREQALSSLGPLRLLRSDLVVLLAAPDTRSDELAQLKDELGEWCGPDSVVGCRLDPEPTIDVRPGARVALFVTAQPAAEGELRSVLARRGIEVEVFSANLARRSALQADLERAARVDCDLYLTELKAAAIDTVAAEAERLGVEVGFIRNRPVSLDGEPDLDRELERLAEQASAAAGSAAAAVGRR